MRKFIIFLLVLLALLLLLSALLFFQNKPNKSAVDEPTRLPVIPEPYSCRQCPLVPPRVVPQLPPLSLESARHSPLLKLAEDIYCARDEEALEVSLQYLILPDEDFPFPDEYLGQKNFPELKAGTLDALVHSLAVAYEKFPEQQELLERRLLQWNFCEVVKEGQFYDLQWQQEAGLVSYPTENFPLEQKGFARWGFLANDPEDRLIPKLLSEPRIRPRHFEYFFHKVFRQMCFPHPDHGKRYLEEDEVRFLPSLRLTAEENKALIYPYRWDPPCDRISVKPIASSAFYQYYLPGTVAASQDYQPIYVVTARLPPPYEQFLALRAVIRPLPDAYESYQPSRNLRNLLPTSEVFYQPTRDLALQPLLVAATEQFDVYEEEQPAELEKELNTAPGVDVTSMPPSNAVAAPPPRVIAEEALSEEEEEKSWGFGGGLTHTWSASDFSPSISGALSYSIYSYWFMRLGLTYNYLDPDKPLTYGWGFGYDDWHSDTWAIQVNHWGPIEPGDGFDEDNAGLSIGYKIKSKTLKELGLAASVGIGIPLNGAQKSFSIGGGWSPAEHWSVSLGLTQSLDFESRPTFSYTFGYSDWHPFTWSIGYANWGPNELGMANFRDKGSLSLGWSFNF